MILKRQSEWQGWGKEGERSWGCGEGGEEIWNSLDTNVSSQGNNLLFSKLVTEGKLNCWGGWRKVIVYKTTLVNKYTRNARIRISSLCNPEWNDWIRECSSMNGKPIKCKVDRVLYNGLDCHSEPIVQP